MSINLTSVFSQLNNPSSLALFAVKDGVDVSGRVGMAYYQGCKGKTEESIESGKHEARERFIDEFGGSLAWLGGVPLFRKLYKETVFKAVKLDPEIHLKKILLDKDKTDEKVQAFAEKTFDKYKNDLADAAVKSKYKRTHIGMVLFSTVIPCLTIAYALPKLNKSITAKIIGKDKHKSPYDNQSNRVKLSKNAEITFAAFKNPNIPVSFKGRVADMLINTAQDAQLSPVNSMFALDIGISGGRVASYGRKPQERFETLFKESGIIFFFFVASSWIKKGLEAIISNKSVKNLVKNETLKKILPDIKLPNIPIHLDPKVIEDKNFAELIKDRSINKHLETFSKYKSSEKDMVSFIKDNLKEGKFNPETGEFKENYVLEAARKSGLIPIEKTKDNKYALNEFKYIETDKILDVHKQLEQVTRKVGKEVTPQNVEAFVRKAKNCKRAAIILNIAICNIFLGFILPKMQYMLREKMTGSNLFPAVRDHLEVNK